MTYLLVMTDALKIKVDTGPLVRLGKKFGRIVDTVDTHVFRAQESLGDRAVEAYSAAARDAGFPNVARGVWRSWQGDTIIINVSARNPETGYDYALITRLGHKVARIFPKSRSRASVVATQRSRKHGQKAMLRFPYHGRVLFRSSVRAWSPVSDWADNAEPEIRVIARDEARKLTAILTRPLKEL